MTPLDITPAQAFSDALDSLRGVQHFCRDAGTLADWYSSVLSLARCAVPYGAWIGESVLAVAGYRAACPAHYEEAEQQLRTICPQNDLDDCLPRDVESLVYRVMAGCHEKDISRWCSLWAAPVDHQA